MKVSIVSQNLMCVTHTDMTQIKGAETSRQQWFQELCLTTWAVGRSASLSHEALLAHRGGTREAAVHENGMNHIVCVTNKWLFCHKTNTNVIHSHVVTKQSTRINRLRRYRTTTKERRGDGVSLVKVKPKVTEVSRLMTTPLIGKHCCALLPAAGCWYATWGRIFPQIYRWHNLDFCIRIVKWQHPTSTNFSICQQWFGTNVSLSMHCRSKRWSWIPWC